MHMDKENGRSISSTFFTTSSNEIKLASVSKYIGNCGIHFLISLNCPVSLHLWWHKRYIYKWKDEYGKERHLLLMTWISQIIVLT